MDAASPRSGSARSLTAAFLVFLGPALVTPIVPEEVLHRFGAGDLGVGLAVAAVSVPGIVGRPLAGLLADRHGPAVTFAAGAGLAGVAVAAMGAAPVFAVFLLLRLTQGAADSLAFVGAAAGQDDGRTGRGAAYTRFATVLTGGTTVGPLLSAVVVDHLGRGWVWVLAGACAFIALAVAPRRPVPPVTGRERGGLFHVASVPAGLGMGLGNVGFVALAGWAVLLAEDRGVGVPGLVLSSFALALTAGRLVGAGWADRHGAPRVITVSAVVAGAGLAGMAVAPAAVGLVAAAGVLGLGSALLMPALLAEAVHRAGAERRGQVVGTIVGGYDACSVLAAVGLGAVAHRFGHAAVFTVGAALTLLSIPVFARWRAGGTTLPERSTSWSTAR